MAKINLIFKKFCLYVQNLSTNYPGTMKPLPNYLIQHAEFQQVADLGYPIGTSETNISILMAEFFSPRKSRDGTAAACCTCAIANSHPSFSEQLSFRHWAVTVTLLSSLVFLTDILDLPCAWLLAWLANTDGTVELSQELCN